MADYKDYYDTPLLPLDPSLESRVTKVEKVVGQLVNDFYRPDVPIVTNTTNTVTFDGKDQRIRGLEAQVEHLRAERDRAERAAREAEETGARNRIYWEKEVTNLKLENEDLKTTVEELESELAIALDEVSELELHVGTGAKPISTENADFFKKFGRSVQIQVSDKGDGWIRLNVQVVNDEKVELNIGPIDFYDAQKDGNLRTILGFKI